MRQQSTVLKRDTDGVEYIGNHSSRKTPPELVIASRKRHISDVGRVYKLSDCSINVEDG
jgi:hypothetical protein